MRLKLLTVLIVFGLIKVQAGALAQQITWSKKDATLTDLFQVIKMQTNLKVLWPAEEVANSKPMDVNFKNSSLMQVLEKCLTAQGLAFTLLDDVVIVKKNVNFLPLQQTGFVASGKITDANGKALLRASIRVKGAQGSFFSDAYGDFKIPNVKASDILIFTHVGFQPQEISAAAYMGIIRLLEVNSMLEEVIISTGYQDIKKKLMTGAIAQMKGEDLVINGNYNLEQMIQGKLAGVEVASTSGLVGTRQTVRVRGTSTLLGNQDPVWVVDGIIQEDPLPFKASDLNRYDMNLANQDGLKTYIGSAISWLNPYDIDDITVLKDAASTAIYGVKAANGVIIINTKRGKVGTSRVNYNSNFSTQAKLGYDRLNLMNSKERVDVSREIYERGLLSFNSLNTVGYQGLLGQYLNKQIDGDTFDREVKILETVNTDWLDLLYQTPFSQNHSVSIGGGSLSNTYYGSLGINDQKGQAKGNGQSSYLGSISFTSNISNKLSIAMRFSGSYSTTEGFYGMNPYTYATTTNRAIPAFTENGNPSYYLANNGYRYNIFNELANTGNQNSKTALTSAVNVKYQLPFGFRFESALGAGFTNSEAELFASENTNQITAERGYEYGLYMPTDTEYKASSLPNGGKLSTDHNKNINYTFRNNLSYTKTLNAVHTVSAMAGIETRSNAYTGQTNLIYGYMPFRGKTVVNPPSVYINAISGSITESAVYRDKMKFSLTDRKSNYVSYYSTAAYSYKDKYVFNINLRGDASNRFGQDGRSRFKPIWALGTKWNVSRENWFEKSLWFNDFSVRATYGYQGNVAENYGPNLIASIPSGNAGLNSLTGEPILRIASLPYSNLRMEKTQSVNLGLDMSFFNNRITASVDYYQKKSKDLIVLKEIPYEFGSATMPVNGGDLYNKGWDLMVNVVPVRSENITWSIGLNSSKNTNKITKKLLPDAKWYNATSGRYAVEDYPISAFWVFDYAGPSAVDGVPTFNIPTDAKGKTDATGYMVYAGKGTPDFTAGINTNFRYKKFSLLVNGYLSAGGKKLLPELYAVNMLNSTPSEYNNLSADFVDRWKKPGDELLTNNPSIPFKGVSGVRIPGEVTPYSPYAFYNFSTARVVNSSYFRINNISFNYTFPDSWSKRVKSKSTMLGYSLSNVHTWVSKDFKGVDAEVASGSQPLPQVHALNFSITF